MRSACRFREFTTDAGVDILSFGGTKNGLVYGEAVVVLNPEASEGLIYLRKLNDAARVQDAVRLGSAHRAARGRPVAALGLARERHGGSAAGRARGHPES